MWRTLHDMSDKEFDSQIAKNQRDVSRLNVGDPTLKAWQDFTDQMHRAGQQLENVFIKGLVALSGPAVAFIIRGDWPRQHHHGKPGVEGGH